MALKEIKKHNAIVNDWLGNYYSEIGYPKAQCVAWIKQYIEERFGASERKSFQGSTYNGWLNKSAKKEDKTFNPDKWKKVYYSNGKIPPVGAILFFEEHFTNNKNGHVAIVDYGSDSNNVVYIEQNGGGGNGTKEEDKIRRNKRKYIESGQANVIGWYEPIIKPIVTLHYPFWDESRPLDYITEHEIDDMLLKSFGKDADFYEIFKSYWNKLEYQENATRVMYFVRIARYNNDLNRILEFQRIDIVHFILRLRKNIFNETRPIATEFEIKNFLKKYFPEKIYTENNYINILKENFSDLQEHSDFRITFWRSIRQTNKVKQFKANREEVLSSIVYMKQKLRPNARII